MKGRMSTFSFKMNMRGKHRAKLKINHSQCIKLTQASVLSYSQTIIAPWLYFAHDFPSNLRSNVRSWNNRIFLRIVVFWRKLGVSVFSSLFMWGVISPIENGNSKWRDTENGFSFVGSHLPCRKFIWSIDLPFSFFHWSRIASFPFLLLFDL